MALNKMVKKLNLESEEIDVSEIEDQTIEDVVEADVNASELQEATKKLEEIQDDFEEGEATAAELQEAIDHTKEVIAKVEEAAEEGKEAEVPVEEVVAAQESLKYFYAKIGFDSSEMVTVSREDIATGSLEAYKNLSANLEQLQVNLEGVLREMIEEAKDMFKNAIDKVKATFGNARAIARVLTKEISSLENDVDSAKASEIVNKEFSNSGFAADLYKAGDISAVVAYADNVQKLVKNITDNNKDATTGITGVKLGGELSGKAAELVREYANDKFSAITGGAYAKSKGGVIITFVDAKDPGLWEIMKNNLNNIIGNAKAIKEDTVKPYPPRDLKLSKQDALKILNGLEVVAKRYETTFKENGGLANLLFGGNILKVLGGTSSGDAGVMGTANNVYRAWRIGLKAATVATRVASAYTDYAKKYAAAVIKASK